MLLGLDHQRTDTSFRMTIYGTASASTSLIRSTHAPSCASESSVTPYYDYSQKTVQTGLYVQDQMALDNWRLTLGGREDWVHQGTTYSTKLTRPTPTAARTSVATRQ